MSGPYKPYPEMTEAERAQIRYTELTMPELRAFIIAHGIRKGTPPAIGANLGFALTVSEAEVEDLARITPEEVAKAIPRTERAWLWFTVTREDVAAGIDLINAQRTTHHQGNTTAPTDQDFLMRLADFLAAAPEEHA